jgi:hypothetical protein
MPLNKKGKEIMKNMKKEYGEKKGEAVFYAMENSGKLKGVKKAKYGKMMKARYGTMAKESTGPALQKEKVKKQQREIFKTKLVKELAGAQVSDKERENIMNLVPKASDNVMTIQSKRAALKMIQKKSMGGSMKKGYGQARTSGMGLEDESLVPGKGYEYIKDLID